MIFFFKQNAQTFPKELIEAARIDGLSEVKIFIKIFMPTMKSTYAAAIVVTFMTSWNNYLWPLIALQSPERELCTCTFGNGVLLYTGLWYDDDCGCHCNTSDSVDFLCDAEAVCCRYDRFGKRINIEEIKEKEICW